MRYAKNFLALMLGLLLVNIANAESPREQLQQMVEQLQKTPTDNTLREKITKLATGIKPAPAIPEEALRYEGRGNASFKNAKEVAGYIAAAREFEAASLAAPWVPGYYSDMCTAYEKGGALREAARSCRLYSMSLINEKEVREAKLRTAGIEYEAEKHSETALREQSKTKKPFGDVQGLPSGNRYFCGGNYQSAKTTFRLGYDLGPVGLLETWLVQNASKASVVLVFWVSTESFTELMKAGVVIKNPLIREFPGTITPTYKAPTFSTDSPDAPIIQFKDDGSLAVTMNYSSGLGRPPSLSGVCEPLR